MRLALLSVHSFENPAMAAVLGGLAGEFSRRGDRVSVWAWRGPGSGPSRESRPWGELRRLGGPEGLFRPLRLARAALELAPAFLLEKPDVAHLHLTGAWGLPVALYGLVCALGGVPFCVTFHDHENPSRRGNGRWARWRLGRLLARSRSVTAVSRALAAEVERTYPELRSRVAVVPNGLTEASFAAPEEKPSPRDGRPFLLCVARLSGYKGIDILLMAFAALSARRPDLDLVICGPDHQGGHYQRLALDLGLEGRARFLGELPPAEVRALIGRCLLLVLPSRHETFGMALLEAMARGKPVVASAVGGIPELVPPSAGLLVPPGDVAALAEALERLARDPGLRAALGAGALEAARSYPWSRAALAYQRAFQGETSCLAAT